jgi:hypothetical protein
MTTLARARYTGYRFPAEIISNAVWLYFRFPLGLRMVEELLAARGIIVSHETVRQFRICGPKKGARGELEPFAWVLVTVTVPTETEAGIATISRCVGTAGADRFTSPTAWRSLRHSSRQGRDNPAYRRRRAAVGYPVKSRPRAHCSLAFLVPYERTLDSW